MAAGNWVDWNTGDLVTAAAFQDMQDSIVFIYASESAANSALTNKVEGTVFFDTGANQLKVWDGSAWQEALTNPIKGYFETDQAVTSSSGVLAIDLDSGNTGTITLTENITDIDFTNVPTNGVSSFTLQITQDTTDRTVAINAVTVNGGSDVTAKTAGGAGFTMSTGSGAIDLVTFLFVDAGTPLLNALQNFS
jgi:hypothetical protein